MAANAGRGIAPVLARMMTGLLAATALLTVAGGLWLSAPGRRGRRLGQRRHVGQPLQAASSSGLNKSLVLDLPADAYDILVANPTVADAVTRTARRIYLFGKQVGQTNVFVFGAHGEQIADLDIDVERDVSGSKPIWRASSPAPTSMSS